MYKTKFASISMRRVSVFLIALLWMTWSQGQDTMVVQTYTFESKSRDSVFTFPDGDHNQYHKIIMEYGMRCHDLAVGNGNVGCREWDYSCNTIIYDSSRVDSILKEENGQLVYEKSSPARFELMSFVTPYGNGLDLGPEGKVWSFDVTDFGPILKGRKRIALVAGGEYQEEMSITFKFIKGTPIRPVIDIQQIWPLGFGINPDPIAADRLFEPRKLAIPQGASQVKLKSVVTGHGQTGEFTPFEHRLVVNAGETTYPYRVWLDCSELPVYPQGGTWLLDRAGWCPGDPSQVNEFFLDQSIVNSGEVTVDYGIKDATNDGQTRYIVNNQVVFYGPLSFQQDAEILAVLQPSSQVEVARYNPVCMNPRMVIRNNGEQPITNLSLSYGIEGGPTLEQSWNGRLGFGETDTVDLDYPETAFMNISSQSRFKAHIKEDDDYAGNNTYYSEFEPVETYRGSRTLILLTTNLVPQDNALVLTNSNGDVVLEYDDLDANRSYFEEVVLPTGCYRLLLTDKSDDGLYFWFYERNGSNLGRGGLEIFVDDISEKVFEPEFGGFVRHDFVVDGRTSTAEAEMQRLRVYPNPTENQINVLMEEYQEDVELKLIDLNGRVISRWKISGGNIEKSLMLDVEAKGVYILQLQTEKRMARTQIIVD